MTEIKLNDRECLIENFIDITKRKQMEEALKKYEKKSQRNTLANSC